MNSDASDEGALHAKISYSQNFEDVYINRVFAEIDDGFYIDVGAYHPSDDSVTKYFYDKGWNGINVEPGPNFEKLACRERDINVKVAISDRSGQQIFAFNDAAPGTSMLVAGSAPEVSGVQTFTVGCMTLEQLVAQYAPDRHIHFLKLDIEGVEGAVIRSTDWSRLRPELLVIESTLPLTNIRCDDEWRTHLEQANFAEIFFDGINVYYLRAESLHRAHALDRPVNVLDGFVKRGRADDQLDELKRHYAWLDNYRYKLEADLAQTSEAARRDLAWSLAQRQAADVALAARERDYRWLKEQHDALQSSFAEHAECRRAAESALATLSNQERSLREGYDALLIQVTAELQRSSACEAWLREAEHGCDVRARAIDGLQEELAQTRMDRDRVRDAFDEAMRRAQLTIMQGPSTAEREFATRRTVRGVLRRFLERPYRFGRRDE